MNNSKYVTYLLIIWIFIIIITKLYIIKLNFNLTPFYLMLWIILYNVKNNSIVII